MRTHSTHSSLRLICQFFMFEIELFARLTSDLINCQDWFISILCAPLFLSFSPLALEKPFHDALAAAASRVTWSASRERDREGRPGKLIFWNFFVFDSSSVADTRWLRLRVHRPQLLHASRAALLLVDYSLFYYYFSWFPQSFFHFPSSFRPPLHDFDTHFLGATWVLVTASVQRGRAPSARVTHSAYF